MVGPSLSEGNKTNMNDIPFIKNEANDSGICDETEQMDSYCSVCKEIVDESDTNERFSIECNRCQQWFHGKCAKLDRCEIYYIKEFHCYKCTDLIGPSTYHPFVSAHRLDLVNPLVVHLPSEIGSKKWTEQFALRETSFAPVGPEMLKICSNGYEFLEEMKKDDAWVKLYLIKSKDGLGLKVPKKAEFGTEVLLDMLGHDYPLDVIDVHRQETIQMSLAKFHNKFSSNDRRQLYNSLSLEFSDSQKMTEIASLPDFVRKCDFSSLLWPDESGYRGARSFMDLRPRVSLYSLVSMTGSYTDYHIDFGGTAVYYHVLKGQKIFYIAAPTTEHLSIFEKWQITGDTTVDFMSLMPPGSIKRLVISEGETAVLPGGYIHAVYTPVDSLVFGGNFLHLSGVAIQLRIQKLEMKINASVAVDDKFYYPNFIEVNVLAVKNIVIPAIRASRTPLTPQLQSAVDEYQKILPEWIEDGKNPGFEKMIRSVSSQLNSLLTKHEKCVYSPTLNRIPNRRRCLTDEASAESGANAKKMDNKGRRHCLTNFMNSL